MTQSANSGKVPRPPFRRLRTFAFDPSLNRQLDTAVLNQVTLEVPWEEELQWGPVGEYLEVVDYDPASGAFYAPVDLNNPYLLAQNGLPPSEGNPQFHQQMVYAVAMKTIRHFEEALGRRALWSITTDSEAGSDQYRPVFRLRIYPHALREANAYYSPDKKALLFGYFPASANQSDKILSGNLVFTCLSHDIIAHETTHALLDGLHRRFVEPSNVDVLAFHEAFADIVALFQHFSLHEVLCDQIARTRGELDRQNLLAQLAQEFGQAIGNHGALRDALGEFNRKTGEWQPKAPDPEAMQTTFDPHARGAILVAAVFDAFLTIYKSRIGDLVRIATGGSGVLPPGAIHPDLVGRLAQEAAKTSRQVLRICIRALDYCPPVDITFGDYLRALITADVDLVSHDPLGYRIAFIEAFRRHGIYPGDVRSLSQESLLWRPPSDLDADALGAIFGSLDQLRELCPDWGLDTQRDAIFHQSQKNQVALQRRFTTPPQLAAARAVGLRLEPDAPGSIYRSRRNRLPSLEVHSVRPAHRVGPSGNAITDLVVVITGRRRGYYDPDVQHQVDSTQKAGAKLPEPDFIFRGGTTLLVSLDTGEVRYAIGKGIASQRRLEAQRRFLRGQLNVSLRTTYFGDPRRNYFEGLATGAMAEPFALLHRVADQMEEP
jgi:hypothetical protein